MGLVLDNLWEPGQWDSGQSFVFVFIFIFIFGFPVLPMGEEENNNLIGIEPQFLYMTLFSILTFNWHV